MVKYIRPSDKCDRRDQLHLLPAQRKQAPESLVQAGFESLHRQRWHLPLWALKPSVKSSFLVLGWSVPCCVTCDHCFIPSLWLWEEELWGQSWVCSPMQLAISTGCSTVGQLWWYIWKCPILLPLKEGARSPLLMRATALDIFFSYSLQIGSAVK